MPCGCTELEMTPTPTPHLIDADIDALGKMVYTLLGELWIVRDRLAVVERMLAERGGPTAEEIDDYVPAPAFSAELETMRERMVKAVLGAPFAGEAMGVDAILARANLARPVGAV